MNTSHTNPAKEKARFSKDLLSEKMVERSHQMVRDACEELSTSPKSGKDDVLSPEMKNNNRPAFARSLFLTLSAGATVGGIAAFMFLFDGDQTHANLVKPVAKQSAQSEQKVAFANVNMPVSRAFAQPETEQKPKVRLLNSQQVQNLKQRLEVSARELRRSDSDVQQNTPSKESTQVHQNVQAVEQTVASVLAFTSKTDKQLPKIVQDGIVIAANDAKANNPANVEPIAASQDDQKLQALTNSVVLQLKRLKSQETNLGDINVPDPEQLRRSIENLVLEASKQNKPNDEIEQLLKDALDGKDAVPQALANAKGELDIQQLLQSVVSKFDPKKVASSDTSYLAALEEESAVTTLVDNKTNGGNKKGHINAHPRIIMNENGAKITVIEGDTLSKLAKLAYNDVLSYAKIFRANRKVIKDPNILRVGAVLRLP